MKIRIAIGVFCLAVMLKTAAHADSVVPQVDKLVQAQMAANHVPGLSLAVVRDGKIILAKGYGKASLELDAPAESRSIYPIGSLSKQFTATAILLLVQDHKLSLDTPISTLLTTLKLPAAWSPITVRNLLNQTTGLASYTVAANMNPNTSPLLKTYSPQEIVDLIAPTPLNFTPGKSFEYSNSNYFLLAQVVLAVSGKDVYTLLTERVFKPLKMISTEEFDQTAIVPNRASRYLFISGQTYNNAFDTDPSFRVGAGGIESSVLDLAKWDSALYTDSILTHSSKEAMWSAPDLVLPGEYRYGFGWVIDTVHGHRLIWHNGAVPGSAVWMGRYIDDDLTVIILTNTFNVDALDSYIQSLDHLGRQIAGVYLPSLKP